MESHHSSPHADKGWIECLWWILPTWKTKIKKRKKKSCPLIEQDISYHHPTDTIANHCVNKSTHFPTIDLCTKIKSLGTWLWVHQKMYGYEVCGSELYLLTRICLHYFPFHCSLPGRIASMSYLCNVPYLYNWGHNKPCHWP